jgi:protein gp37
MMSERSTIEWTDATWNPVTGCTKVSPGCKNCYAERVFKRVYPGRSFSQVKVHKDRLLDPSRWRRPRRIFVNSLSDLFHRDISDDNLALIIGVMEHSPQHTFQILTKRPERMMKSECFGLPTMSHVWLGVSVEDQKTADQRIPLLLRTPAAVRFVSYEPALEPLDLTAYLTCFVPCPLNWVIAGGESGPGARPSHPNWFRSVRDQCQAAHVPFFFKQWGEWVSVSEVAGPGEHHHFPDGATVRRTGKKLAGRLLDGREWNEYPGRRVSCQPLGQC